MVVGRLHIWSPFLLCVGLLVAVVLAVVRWVFEWMGGLGLCSVHSILAMVPLLGLFPGNWVLTDLGVMGMWGRCVWRRVVLRVVGG